jgi:hypothetical protein
LYRQITDFIDAFLRFQTGSKILSSWVKDTYEMAAQERFFSGADFVLVGFAHAHSHIVVTQEVASSGFHVKIPNACKAMDVKCMSPFEMLKIEKAQFTLPPKTPN